jgi:hypothetical protein
LLLDVVVGVGLLVEVTVGVTDVDAAAPDGEVLEGAVTVAGCDPPQAARVRASPATSAAVLRTVFPPRGGS